MAFSRIELKKMKPSNVIQNMDQKADMSQNYIVTIKIRLDDESEQITKKTYATKITLGRKAIYKVWIYIHYYLYGYFTEIPLFCPESMFLVRSLLRFL